MLTRRIKLVVAGVILAAAVGALAEAPLTVDDVIKLVQNKISDAVIIAQIEHTNTYFSISAEDIIKLKSIGASDNLMNYMIARKPGGPPSLETGTATTAGGFNVNVTGRTTEPSVTETPPPKKFQDLTLTIDGKYIVSSQSDLNVYYAVYVDGERVFYWDEWSSITKITSAESGQTVRKLVLEPKGFTAKIAAGAHTLTVVMWSGASTIDDNTAKAYAVYTKPITVLETQPFILNLKGETDANGKFVVR